MTRTTFVLITLMFFSSQIFANNWQKGLEPQGFWTEFSAISQIYRPSKGEQKIAAYVENAASQNGLKHSMDSCGNVLVKIPATAGRQNQSGIVLQCHLDMVCIATKDSNFVWGSDQIKPFLENGWLKSAGTTLGADNGVGVAAMLDIIKRPPQNHGPIELLFTVDEECDFSGVCGLKPDQLQGKFLLNLDSEEAGEFNIGCAGGQADIIETTLSMKPVDKNSETFELSISGGKGGHSGVDIHRGRANSIAELFRILRNITTNAEVRLVSCEGGSTDTAIPTDAKAIFSCEKSDVNKIKKIVKKCERILKRKFQNIDAELRVNLNSHNRSLMAATANDSKAFINCCYEVPAGIIAMSKEWTGNVQTSMNPGILKSYANTIKLVTHIQGSTLPTIAMLSRRISKIAEKYLAKHIAGEPYRPWEAGNNADLLHAAMAIHQSVTGKAPKLKIVHAGVECGELKNIYPQLQMLSFGPDIRDAHTPSEMVNVDTVADFLHFLHAMIDKLP